ncbi:NAD(P)/FAD-dependent oxidoreductase [Aquimarina sp. ERC-38]|uniref:NAD(P)/FAD-dependent oxidoreductase n=1 Tax=Aquimarina sp. ERC-38 TaxID=2949996 RepID=UPI002248717B|nr:FAD/NAD(P)-binding oxidoreductase [Aquimarina sp. ERC-38]UZO82609.1 NAD(P)/FAD-dependent oxidoreductase [Aquimarina sp. ERC-38]
MTNQNTEASVCVVIGASHAGVNFAFSLRKEGWKGDIRIFDQDPNMPYHRPPLSKAYLTSDDEIDKNLLKSAESYEKDQIQLQLGITVKSIDTLKKTITTSTGSVQNYDKLVIATGARPLVPPIKGLTEASELFTLRTIQDAHDIRKTVQEDSNRRVVIIGGGYIGLEIAASLRKLGATVSLLERESRILARVTTEDMSRFFHELHTEKGVDIHTQKNVSSIATENHINTIMCDDGTEYKAEIIVLGVGVRVNTELAKEAGLKIENGISVNQAAQTSDPDIYAIGDCTYHHNPHYDRYIRLESVQNAVDQAKIAAASICGKEVVYNAIPWFWSDQYDIKLQIVGLSLDFDESIIRSEEGSTHKFSIWYFKNDELQAVDAINNAKAYVLGTKFIKDRTKINKDNLKDTSAKLSSANLIMA